MFYAFVFFFFLSCRCLSGVSLLFPFFLLFILILLSANPFTFSPPSLPSFTGVSPWLSTGTSPLTSRRCHLFRRVNRPLPPSVLLLSRFPFISSCLSPSLLSLTPSSLPSCLHPSLLPRHSPSLLLPSLSPLPPSLQPSLALPPCQLSHVTEASPLASDGRSPCACALLPWYAPAHALHAQIATPGAATRGDPASVLTGVKR